MRSRLSVALMLGLIAVGAAWAFNTPAVNAGRASAGGFGCCVTGDCCCPGQGACCDPDARATAKAAASARKGSGCCVTGDCCCPGQGSCCAAQKVDADARGCCPEAAPKAGKDGGRPGARVTGAEARGGGCCETGDCRPVGAP